VYAARMADAEFRGVPERDWRDLSADVRRLDLAIWLLILVVYLLVMALISKGVLTGWSDLLKAAVPGG
jgi:hypothetical protein